MNGPDRDFISIKTDIGVIKNDITTIQAVYKQLEATFEKMVSITNDVNKLLLMQENRVTLNENNLNHLALKVDDKDMLHDKEIALIQDRLDAIQKQNSEEREKNHKEIMDRLKDMGNDQKSLEARIMKLESWRWYVIGGMVIVIAVLSRIPWMITLIE